jgi:gamma-glutamylcyclotransferase (GGCT)/AIG2-like uncharacterized protein YtfP
MKLYFAYGANLNIDNMIYRCADAVEVEPFYLKGWRLAFSGVATIVPDPVSTVAGALWAISDEDERALDVFEGWPTLYRKETIQSDGIEFMVYVMNSTQPWEPSSGYLSTIAQGYRDWNLDLDHLSRAVLRTQEETDDLYRNTSSRTRLDRISGLVASDVYLEPSDDVRWLRDLWHTDRSPSTLE